MALMAMVALVALVAMVGTGAALAQIVYPRIEFGLVLTICIGFEAIRIAFWSIHVQDWALYRPLYLQTPSEV